MKWTTFNTPTSSITYNQAVYLFDKSQLSVYERNILNKAIAGFTLKRDFNLYELVQDAISPNFIFPSQNGEILETFYGIRDYLIALGFIIERKEMVAYSLTEKGKLLMVCGSIEEFEKWQFAKQHYYGGD